MALKHMKRYSPSFLIRHVKSKATLGKGQKSGMDCWLNCGK